MGRPTATVKAVGPEETFKSLPPAPPKPKPEPPKPPKQVEVTYDGNHRVVHTLTGKVFLHGDTHRMTDAEALDLQKSLEPFTVRDLRKSR